MLPHIHILCRLYALNIPFLYPLRNLTLFLKMENHNDTMMDIKARLLWYSLALEPRQDIHLC